MSLPYYKRFPRDFLEATIGLSFEVKGAFAIVLDLIYMRDGRLPDDPRYIAGQLGCSVRKWTAIRVELIDAGKLSCVDGIISNFRADYLTEETRKYQDKQAEIAGKPRKNKGLRQPEPSQPESEPKIEETKNVSSIRSVIAKPNGFASFWEAYSNKTGKGAAEAAYIRALKRVDGPDPPGVILAGVERAKASRKWREGYIKNPATWLNQDCWTDEEPADERPDPNSPSRSSHAGRSRAESNFAGAALALERRRADRLGANPDPDEGGPPHLALISG